MNPSPPNPLPPILGVGLDLDSLPVELGSLLKPLGPHLATCPDVFRALARLDRLGPSAVLLDVEWLSREELEFIRVVRGRRPDLLILVWGSQRAAAKIEYALHLGATGPLNTETAGAVLADRAAAGPRPGGRDIPRAADADRGTGQARTPSGSFTKAGPPQGAARSGGPTGRTPPPAVEPIHGLPVIRPVAAPPAREPGPAVPRPQADQVAAPGDCDEDLADSDPDEESDDPPSPDPEPPAQNTGRARVPWVRYDERPRPSAPRRVPPAAREENPDYPPLLTPEELEALLGDDEEEGP